MRGKDKVVFKTRTIKGKSLVLSTLYLQIKQLAPLVSRSHGTSPEVSLFVERVAKNIYKGNLNCDRPELH